MSTLLDRYSLAQIQATCREQDLDLSHILFGRYLVQAGHVSDAMPDEPPGCPLWPPCASCGAERPLLTGTDHCQECSTEGLLRKLARCWGAER